MPKERKKPKHSTAPKLPSPPDKRPAGKRSAADQERALQLLDKARTRDLTPDELKILSVVQLSQYATIRLKRQTESR
jgi:hypothetical protein